MPLDSFLGNARCVEVLRQALSRNRLPHALLFAGPEAVGKRFLALQLAMTLNCLESQGQDCCGTCRSCQLIRLGNHPDVSILEPEGDGQFIKIEKVRQLIREAVRNPFQGRFRVFILDQAHRLNPASGNALLKILEEPPLSTKLVLVTAQPHALLTTVRSRCQLLSFAPLAEVEIAAILESRFQIAREEAVQRARLADGSLGRAVSLDLKRYALLADAARSFVEMSVGGAGLGEIAETLTRVAKERADTEAWVAALLAELSHQVHRLARQGKGAEVSGPSFEQLHRMAGAAERLRRNLDHNINRVLALENLYLQFVRIGNRG